MRRDKAVPNDVAATELQHARVPDMAELMSSAAAGDMSAFNTLYRMTAKSLLARVRLLVGDSLAEDVLSDVYLQVWRTLPSFDPERGTPMAWLAVIARTRAVDCLRTELRKHGGTLHEELEDEQLRSDADGPEALADRRQTRERVRACLDKLPARERLVLGLAYFRDCTESEISAFLGMPLGTVKSVIYRSHAKLRLALAPPAAPSAVAEVAMTAPAGG